MTCCCCLKVFNKEDYSGLLQWKQGAGGTFVTPPLSTTPFYLPQLFLQTMRASQTDHLESERIPSSQAQTSALSALWIYKLPWGPSAPFIHLEGSCGGVRVGAKVGAGQSPAQVPANPMPVKSLLFWPLSSLCLRKWHLCPQGRCV